MYSPTVISATALVTKSAFSEVVAAEILLKVEVERPALVMTPVLLIAKSVEVALAVEEPIAKSVVLVEPLLAWISNSANGDVLPTLVLPFPAWITNGFCALE